jgi:hypothetical protein
MYAHSELFFAGTEATAEAVSWPPTLQTAIRAQPSSSASSFLSLPKTVEGWASFGKRLFGRPSFSMTSKSQSRFFASRSWLVLASVYSQTASPQKR